MANSASPSSTDPLPDAGSTLGVAIVSYNTRPLLERCLAALFAELDRGPWKAEVCVVDNASRDGSPETVAARYPGARLLALERNVGFAAANNRVLAGWQTNPVPHRFWLLLNPDAELQPHALEHLTAALAADPGAAVAGPQLCYADGRFQHSAFRFPGLLQWWFDLFPVARLYDSPLNGRYPRRAYERGDPFVVDFPLGACLLVSATAAARVGLLDADFFLYCEEIDWCLRFRQAGYHCLCVPQAHVVHHAGASTQQTREATFVQLWRSRLRLVDKHWPAWQRPISRGALAAGFRLRALADGLATRRGRLGAEERERRSRAYRAIFAP